MISGSQALAAHSRVCEPSGVLVCVLCGVLLAACGSAPVTPPSPARNEPTLVVAPVASLAFERRQLDRAALLTRQGALAEAAQAWEILGVLRPDNTDYAQRLAELRRRVDEAVAERLPRAAQAARRGELDAAAQQYLAILALQPDQAQAAEALRAIERQRVRRDTLGKLSRITLARRGMVGSLASPADRNEVEHAAMLADQGEFDDAIGLLEHRLAADSTDLQARDLLAEVYCRKGDALSPVDRPAAAIAYERCLRWRPGHPLAISRLRELRSPAGS